MKILWQEHNFEDREQLLEGIYDFFEEVDLSELMIVFHHSIGHMSWVIEHDEEYYQEETI
jgi:hypothetical protein